MSTSSNPPAPKGVIPALMFGNAVIGTGVMIVPGTLNDISASLQVTVAAAGQLVSVAGLLMCFGAPLLATAVASRDRRTLLALAMAWYGVLHLLCAAAPDFGSLLVLRALAVASPALFTPQAAACVGLLVPAHERGRAISMVLLGWSAALVVGLPLGAWVGGHWGWRVAFSLVSALSFASAAWVWWAMPRGIRPGALPLSAWREILQSRPAVLCLLVSFLSSAGQFVVFAYLAPYLHALLQVTPAQLGLLFAWFGSFGVLGVLIVSRHVDRLGAERAVAVCLALMALSMLVWPLGHSLAAMALVLVPWALGTFSSNSAQQARLAAMAPARAPASIALNTSAIYIGQATGAAIGGWLVATGRMDQLHWAALVHFLLAIAVSLGVAWRPRTAQPTRT